MTAVRRVENGLGARRVEIVRVGSGFAERESRLLFGNAIQMFKSANEDFAVRDGHRCIRFFVQCIPSDGHELGGVRLEDECGSLLVG